MNTKRTKLIVCLCAAGLLFAAEAFAQGFPAYLTMEGTVITGCDQAALPANLVIPDGVTEICWNAFSGCTSLLTVSIPTSVTEIISNAFLGCDNIKTVQYRGTLAQWCQIDNDYSLVKNAKTITMSDIVDLKAMTALTIPDGVTKIGRNVFHDCTSLVSVTIPASVTEISQSAFGGCHNIKTVRYGGTLAQWCQIDNDWNLVGNAETIALSDVADLKAMTALAIPDGVKKIGESAFYGCTLLATVSIPASVTEIRWGAFFGCTSLATVSIPDGVTEIDWDAFSGCTSLATVSIPASVKKIDGSAFVGCDNIKTVQYRGTLAQWCQMDNAKDLVANAKTITMSDIVDLKAMTALAIPDGVAKIGGSAFAGCKSLVSVSFPASVTEIGWGVWGAFHNCDNIKTVQYRGTLAQWCQMDNDGSLVHKAETITMSDIVDLKAVTALTIPDGVTKIGNYALDGCWSLVTVSIPVSVKKIGAFIGRDNMTVQYRGTLAQWCQIDNGSMFIESAKSITMSDVADLKAMTALAIPDGVTKIGMSAFSSCTSLANVSISTGVTLIGAGAFANCTSLASITLPASVTEIGEDAFYGCTSLAKIVFTGTKTQWQAFNVRLNPGAVVHCADGDYVKE